MKNQQGVKVSRIGQQVDPVREAIASQKPLLASAFGFSAVMSILGLTTSFYMLLVYDRVLTSRSTETLLLLTVIAAAGIIVFSALDSLRLRLLWRVGMRVAEDLSPRVLRAMVATASQTGGTAARTGMRDLETIRNFVGSSAFASLLDAPFVLIYLLVLLMISPIFLGIVVLGGMLLAFIAIANQRATDPLLVRSLSLSAHAQAFAEDGLQNSDVLEGMGMSNAFVGRWRMQWLQSLALGTTAGDRDSRYSSLSRGVRMLIQILLLGAGAMLILHFKGTGGIMIGASIIGARALAPIDAFVSMWKNVVAVRLSWARLGSLLEYAPQREEGIELPAPKGRIEVTSAYYVVASSRKAVLSNVNFELKPGESLGIIGPSASGKSTLLRLLVGAWPCTSGNVRLDGADIYAWPRSALSRYIGYLPQDVELFSGTVRENIARISDGDSEAIVRAAQRAGAHEMILGLPKGYDTDIGDHGHSLSGGQSQRIGIARALYGSPRLIALDEPNSNLDGQGEEALVATLAGLKADGVTIAIVAHRPSILQSVDKMLVLRPNGSVEMFGPRAEVMQHFMRSAARGTAHIVPVPAAGFV